MSPTAATVLSTVLALIFIPLGLAKILSAKPMRETAARIHVPYRLIQFIGVLEVSASAGLLIGIAVNLLGIAAAVGLTLLMIGGFFAHVRAKEPAQGVPALVLAIIAGVTVALLVGTA